MKKLLASIAIGGMLAFVACNVTNLGEKVSSSEKNKMEERTGK